MPLSESEQDRSETRAWGKAKIQKKKKFAATSWGGGKLGNSGQNIYTRREKFSKKGNFD